MPFRTRCKVMKSSPAPKLPQLPIEIFQGLDAGVRLQGCAATLELVIGQTRFALAASTVPELGIFHPWDGRTRLEGMHQTHQTNECILRYSKHPERKISILRPDASFSLTIITL